MPKPVIVLAFANERVDGQSYLRNLPLEQNRLRQKLEKAEDANLCEVVVLPNVTLDDLMSTFQRQKYRDRIAIFHYGGHAESYELLLETDSGKTEAAHGEGLVPFLAGQRGLNLVFLNGCHSAQQAQALIDEGVPAVIGTSNAIRDDLATDLASSFYRSLGEGVPLEKAWREAETRIKAAEGTKNLNQYYRQDDEQNELNRGIGSQVAKTRDQFPWKLYLKPGEETIRDWNLPVVANDPYFGLPDISSSYGLPEVPYRFLARYTKEDARIFFGRGNYVRDLYHRLSSPHAAPVLLLYGQSGVGKSSLLEAGLFPRLENEFDLLVVRRDPKIGLSGHLRTVLNGKEEKEEGIDLLQCWKQLEANSSKKGFILVLDQVEEVFTRPTPKEATELEDFLKLLSDIFTHAGNRPSGKVILSYRKEYDPEIEKACRKAGIPKEKVFLDRLDQQGIVEIVEGLASTDLLRNKYRLSIEDDLPIVIADDLLIDNNSSITPVLQIILTRLWQEEEEKDSRHFSRLAYTELQKKGIFLDDFFQQQMEELKQWEEQVQQQAESSGLALDVLHFHTTPLGTAEKRDLDELRQIYQHQADVLESLIQQFKSLYLLSMAGKSQSALAHDTLAPVIQKELNESDKPGQRAARILSSKMIDYELQPERTFIDQEDLTLVEEGAAGMRIWTKKEQELIQKSQKRRAVLQAERRRNRYLKRGLIGLTLLVLVIVSRAAVLWWRASEQALVDQIVQTSLQQQKADPTQAFEKAQQAWDKIDNSIFNLDDQLASLARLEIHRDNEFYQLLPFDLPSNIMDIQVLPKTQQILLACGNQASIWEVDFESSQVFIDSLVHPSQVTSVSYSKDEQLILTASMDSSVRLWKKNSNEEPEKFVGSTTFYSAVFSPDEQWIYGGASDGYVYQWDRNGKASKWPAHKKGVTTFALDSSRQIIITGSLDSKVYIWDMKSKQKIDSLIYDRGKGIIRLDYDNAQGRIVVGYLNGIARLWDIQGELVTEMKGHKGRINDVSFSPDHQHILTASLDQQIKLWNQEGDLIKSYKGHNGYVQAVSFSSDGAFFASAGQDRTVKWWKRNSKIAREFELPNEVTMAAFLPDGQGILTSTNKDAYWLDFLKGHMQTFTGHKGWIHSGEVSPDGKRFYTGSDDSTVIIWNQSGEQLYQFKGHQAPVYTLALSPTNSTIASGGADSMVLLWNREGMILDSFPHPDQVRELVFSPNGKHVLTGCLDGLARLWKNGQTPPQEFEGSAARLNAVDFSPDGRYIAASGAKKGSSSVGIFSVWQVGGKLLFEKEDLFSLRSEDGLRISLGIAFSSDSQYVMVGSAGGEVQIYDLRGQLMLTLNNIGKGEVYSVSFSPNNDKYLLNSGKDGKVRLFANPLKMPTLHNNSWYQIQ